MINSLNKLFILRSMLPLLRSARRGVLHTRTRSSFYTFARIGASQPACGAIHSIWRMAIFFSLLLPSTSFESQEAGSFGCFCALADRRGGTFWRTLPLNHVQLRSTIWSSFSSWWCTRTRWEGQTRWHRSCTQDDCPRSACRSEGSTPSACAQYRRQLSRPIASVLLSLKKTMTLLFFISCAYLEYGISRTPSSCHWAPG